MYVVRLFSAIATVYVLYQFAQEPENIDSLTHVGSDSIQDLFQYGMDRFVLGKLPDAGPGSKKKKSHYDIFMEAILEDEEEKKTITEEATVNETQEEGPVHNEDEYGPVETEKDKEEVEQKKEVDKEEEL